VLATCVSIRCVRQGVTGRDLDHRSHEVVANPGSYAGSVSGRIRSEIVTGSCTYLRSALKWDFRTPILVLFAAVLAGCSPLYVSDASITSTPKARSFDVSQLASDKMAVLGLVAPVNLQGFSPSLSLALASAIAQVRPPIQAIPAYGTVSLLNEQGLARDYAALISGYAQGGILEQQRLRRIGSALHSRYLLLPGLAEFDQTIEDRFETMGLKLLRNRVTTLRLWLQLWDAQTGQIVWESGGEVTAVTQLLRTKQTVPVDQIAQRLWVKMLQEGLLEAKTEMRLSLRN
jgi:hypothetical protein